MPSFASLSRARSAECCPRTTPGPERHRADWAIGHGGESRERSVVGEAIAALVGKLAQDQMLTLPGVSVEGMHADLEVVQRLRPLAQEVESLGRLLSDTLLEANSEAWWAATAYYTSLGRMSAADPKLQAALQPAVSFFARGRRKKVENEEE